MIGTHLAELIRRHAHELWAAPKCLLDPVNDSHPQLMEELLPKLVSLDEIQKVLQQLLREQVSIRNLGTMLEMMVEAAAQSKHVVFLTERIRQALGRSLVRPARQRWRAGCAELDRSVEEQIIATFDPEGTARLLGDSVGPRPLERTSSGRCSSL